MSVRFGEASTQGFGRIDVNRSYRVCDKGGASERFRLNGSFARSAAKRDEALPGGSLRTPTICAFCRLVLRQNLAHLWDQSVNQPPTFEQSGEILP
jgi:hypothetical protein